MLFLNLSACIVDLKDVSHLSPDEVYSCVMQYICMRGIYIMYRDCLLFMLYSKSQMNTTQFGGVIRASIVQLRSTSV